MTTMTMIGTNMFTALGWILSSIGGESTSSSIIGVAPGQSSSPPRVRASAFFIGPRSIPKTTVASATTTATSA